MRMILDGRGQYFPGDNSFPTLARQMDHDIRSPLTAICSYAECIAWLPNLEPGVREAYANTILAEARRLGRLASNFLVLAAPPLSNDLDELDLGLVFTEVLEELRDVIEVHGYEITWERPAQMGLIWPHAVLLQLLTAALEAALETCKGCKALRLALTDVSEQDVRIELISPRRELSRATETFAYRATEVLARQRGGEVSLDGNGETHLILHLPRVGRVCGSTEQESLERSA